MEIKYTKNVQWLKPFVESAKNLVNIYNIKSIRGYLVPLHKEACKDGRNISPKGQRKRHITLRIWDHDGKKQYRKRYEDILTVLAHELAHVSYWEHTPDHFELMAKIMVTFKKELVKENITDTSARFSPHVEQKHVERLINENS